jgi:GGDEF domain-containing protein/EAL domain-containing protein (putative c-di-GMP-specific phosphodiesterase class I)
MHTPSNLAIARLPGCDSCAAEITKILGEHAMVAGFRPIANLKQCEILGYITTVRGPAGMLHGAYGRLAKVSQQLNLLNEFCRDSLQAIIRRFQESNCKGLLFIPLPAGAIEVLGNTLAESIHQVVLELGQPPASIVFMFPDIAPGQFPVAVNFASNLLAKEFQLASRSFGCALTEQELWSGLPVSFMLLEEHLFEGIDLARIGQNGLSTLLAAEVTMGRRVIADGIRNGSDLKALSQLGIAFGAGDYIGRSNALPTRAMSAAAHKAISSTQSGNNIPKLAPGSVIDRLLSTPSPVFPETTSDEVFKRFEENTELRAIAVVENVQMQGQAHGQLHGLISRYEMLGNMSRPYRHEVYGRKPCTRFMDAKPLVVDIGVNLCELTELVVGADPRHLISGFIITDQGRYVGMGSVQDLVREVTAMQMEAAKYANPLTQLPGNVPINQHIDNLLEAGEICCIAYCDLDHFKPFNDVYGYAMGDEVIQLTAHVLTEACDAEQDFIGHIGGDDFVLILRSADWEARCNNALAAFGSAILKFFSNDDIERGGYITENRKGEMDFHRLTSLSIGAIEARAGMFKNHLQVSIAAAEVKKRAKGIPGNSLFINQRIYASDTHPMRSPVVDT